MTDTLSAQIDHKLRNASKRHPYFAEMFFSGRLPTVGVSDAERIDGLVSLVGGLIGAVDALAREIDKINSH